MKNNFFLMKWEPGGSPYLSAELKNEMLYEKLKAELTRAAVWLTDDAKEARRLVKEGACVVYLLTRENRGAFCDGVEWCAQMPESVEEDKMYGDGDGGALPSGRRISRDGETPAWKARLADAKRNGLPAFLPEEFLWRVWLRSRGLPWHICETFRLALREMMEEDLDFLYEMQTDAENARFLDGLSESRETELEKLSAYRKQMYGFYGFGIWIIIEKESGCPVGRAGLQMRDGFEEPELGFAVAEKYRRRGYAKEACEAVLAYARDGLGVSKVRAVVEQENIKSRKLCERLGFFTDNRLETDGRMCISYVRPLFAD